MLEPTWKTIVAESLAEGLGTPPQAVSGAKLRQIISRKAPRHSLTFPPEAYAGKKFSEFLGEFASILILRRRKGQDVLIASIDRPDLLLNSESGVASKLRDDVFKAFTKIGGAEMVWYSRPKDLFVWLPESNSDAEALVRVPLTSLEAEISIRSGFIDQPVIEDQIKLRLRASLSDGHPLAKFSMTVRQFGLSEKWHKYRLNSILERIKGWCADEDVMWREHWIVEQLSPVQMGSGDDIVNGPRRELIARMVDRLGDSDLQRISVPLDLVLRLLG